MSVWPILLRVLLSLSLILNGSGYAVASSHMQMGTMDMATAVVAPVVEPPCHQQHHDDMSMTAPDASEAGADAVLAKSGHPSPDCGKSNACQCVCTYQAQAAVPAWVFSDAVIKRAHSVRSMKPAHASPVLPHLIRPPIG